MVLPNGVVWQQHLLVLMVSAKLLADAEAAMQRHGDAAGSKQQRMGAGGWGLGCHWFSLSGEGSHADT
jgi:hypothetical protein